MADKGNNYGYEEVLVNGFTEENAKKFREAFLSVAKRHPKKPIVVWINSYGGMVDALATIVETMKSVPNKVVTACVGIAASCGAVLLSFGDERYCGPRSRIMIHSMSSCSESTPVHEVHTDSKENLRLEEFWFTHLAKNCGIEGGYEVLRAKIKDCEGKIWLDAEGAKAFGIVDAVGIPKVKKITAYVVGVITK